MMSLEEDKSSEIKVQAGWTRLFCNIEYCDGVLTERDSEEIDGQCSVCIESMKEMSVAVVDSCMHTFCKSCIDDWYTKNTECPLCRQSINMVWYLKGLIKPLHFNGVNMDDHLFCLLGGAKSYLMAMEGNWARLIRFIVLSKFNEGKYYGIRGTEVLNLTEYEKEGRILARSKSLLVLKTREDKIQVVCCCQIPCLTIRLVVMANEDDVPVEADSEYADKVVGYLTDQIDACWKVLPQLLKRSHLTRMYIRKFERYTATLNLGGIEDVDIRSWHRTPMKDELSSAKRFNFNPDHHRVHWRKLPPLNFEMLKVMDDYDDSDCCPEVVVT